MLDYENAFYYFKDYVLEQKNASDDILKKKNMTYSSKNR